MTQRLAGKTAPITGAPSGMGVTGVRRFVAEGAKPLFCARSAEAGEAVAAEIGPAARFMRADVTDEADVSDAARTSSRPT